MDEISLVTDSAPPTIFGFNFRGLAFHSRRSDLTPDESNSSVHVSVRLTVNPASNFDGVSLVTRVTTSGVLDFSEQISVGSLQC